MSILYLHCVSHHGNIHHIWDSCIEIHLCFLSYILNIHLITIYSTYTSFSHLIPYIYVYTHILIYIGSTNLSLEDKKKLEDKLEHFKQKLKIAIRKQKQDKLIKYNKKISEIILLLNGGVTEQKGHNSDPFRADDHSEITNETEEESSHFIPLTRRRSLNSKSTDITHTNTTNSKSMATSALPASPVKLASSTDTAAITTSEPLPTSQPAPASAAPTTATTTTTTVPTPAATPAPRIVGSSDVAFHVRVEPEQTVIIKIKITLLPSTNYRSWVDPLPFKGSFRVYECRNEDCVKKIKFIAFVSSPQRESSFPLLSSRYPSLDFAHHGIDKAASATSTTLAASTSLTGSVAASPRDRSGSGEGGQYTLDPSFEESKDQPSTFLVTISQWSSYATRHLYPYYRFNSPLNVLGSCIC